jgi:hypothetical protein
MISEALVYTQTLWGSAIALTQFQPFFICYGMTFLNDLPV